MNDSNILHKGMVPAKKALELVLEDASPREHEIIPLELADRRVLARDLFALRTQPPFAASAMDGYAVRHADIAKVPADLRLVGQSAAGHPHEGSVKAGETVRTFTGAPIPDGADTIIIQENVEARGDTITVLQSAPAGKFVRNAGLDFTKGQKLVAENTVLNPQSLSLAASMGHASLCVWKKPHVAVLATGDELVLPGEDTAPGQIIASNTFGIVAIAQAAGGEAVNLGIAKDTKEDLERLVLGEISNGADLIVTSGGASVGDHDLVKPVMESLGFVFSFIKIAMRPGKPVIFGKREKNGKTARFLGLPGNPVSSLISSHIFLKPLVHLLGGRPAKVISPVQARLGEPLPENDDREDYLRGIAKRLPDGSLEASPFLKQDSSMLATLNKANCLIIRPVRAPAAKPGDVVSVLLLENP